MEEKTLITLFGMGCITTLEAINMVIFGVDSTVLVLIVAVISGLGGYKIKSILGKK